MIRLLTFLAIMIALKTSAQEEKSRKLFFKVEPIEMIVATDFGIESEYILKNNWSIINSLGINLTPLYKITSFRFDETYAQPLYTYDPVSAEMKAVGGFVSVGLRKYLSKNANYGFFVEEELKYKNWSINEYQYSANARIMNVTSKINEIQFNSTVGWKASKVIEFFGGVGVVPLSAKETGSMYDIYKKEVIPVDKSISRIEIRSRIGFRFVF